MKGIGGNFFTMLVAPFELGCHSRAQLRWQHVQ